MEVKEHTWDTMLGLVMGLCQSMASAMLGTIGVKYLLRELKKGKKWDEEPKYGKLGFQLLRKIYWVDERIKVSTFASDWKIPKRFSKRNQMYKFSTQQWDEMMITMRDLIDNTKISLGSCQKICQKVKEAEYKKLFEYLKLKVPKVGKLNANHVLGLLALTGVIPPIMFEEEREGASRGYKLLNEEVSLRKQKISIKEVKEKLQHASKEILKKKKPTKRDGENILCKIGRQLCNSDRLYCDLVDEGFPLVRYDNGNVIFEFGQEVLFKSQKGMIGKIEKLEKFQHTFKSSKDKWMKELKR